MKQIKKNLLLTIGIILISKIGFSCSCSNYEPDFYKNVSPAYPDYTLLAVFVKQTDSLNCVSSLYGQWGHFILIDTVGSKNIGLISGDTFIVEGQDPFNCGESMSVFNLGDTALLALNFKTCVNGYKYGYLEGLCGKQYLIIKNGQNGGLSIKEIRNKINHTITGIDFYSQQSIQIFPNPSTGQFQIEFITPQSGTFILYNSIGEKLISRDFEKENLLIVAMLKGTKNGVYFLEIISNNVTLREKILVLNE